MLSSRLCVDVPVKVREAIRRIEAAGWEIAHRAMHDAIAFHLEGLRAAGEPVPEPSVLAAAYVDVA